MSDETPGQRFATRVIHGGQRPDPLTGAIMPPIYATSTYVQSSPGVHQGYEYSRTRNPTRDALQAAVASLEGGAAGFAFASGMAAATAVFLRPGQGQQPVGCEHFAERLGGRQVFRVVGAGAEEAFGDMRGDQVPQALSEFDSIGAEVVIHRHPFGNPSSRSAMMLRWISDVPP